jgi:MraZ protein
VGNKGFIKDLLMLKGRYEHTIDEKGRVSIPSKFREILTSHYTDVLVLTNDIEPCLVAYPLLVWQEFEKKLSELPQFNEAVRNLKRFYISGATECPIDKQGRIMVPDSLRKYASISENVIIVGQVKTIEIWAREKWNEVFDKSRTSFDTKALADLGL